MNKYALLICFSLLLNFSIELTSDDYENYYDILLSIAEGMTNTNEARCVNHIVQNKAIILNVIQSLAETIEEGGDLISSASECLNNLLFLYDDCNLENIVLAIMGLNSQVGIQNLGYSIAQNAHSIYLIVKDIGDSDNKVVEFGKILSIILNIYVY